jgi:hypothetical protein
MGAFATANRCFGQIGAAKSTGIDRSGKARMRGMSATKNFPRKGSRLGGPRHGPAQLSPKIRASISRMTVVTRRTYLNASITRSIAGCLRFFTLIQSLDRPPR